MSDYLNAEKFWDFEVVCGAHTFHVHRVIIAGRCKYFDCLTTSPFKEAQQQIANFPEDDPAHMARLLYYLYTSTYPDTALNLICIGQFKDIDESQTFNSNLPLRHAKMYSIAIKYGLDDMAVEVAKQFRKTSTSGEDVMFDDTTFKELAQVVYESTPVSARALKDEIIYSIHYVRENAPHYLSMDLLASVLDDVPALAIDLATSSRTEDYYRCEICGESRSMLRTRCYHESQHEYGLEQSLALQVKEMQCWCCDTVGYFTVESLMMDAKESEGLRRISIIGV